MPGREQGAHAGLLRAGVACALCGGVLPERGFLHSRAQKRQRDCDDREVREDDAGPENPEWCEHEEHGQHHHGAEIPEHLRHAAVLAALAGRRHLGDQRPRGRNIRSHREADEDEAHDDHPRLHGEDEPEHAERIEQHVVLVDLLASEEIAQPPADERTHAGGNGIRAEGTQHAYEGGAQAVGRGPERECRRAGDDGTRVDVVRKARENRVLPVFGGSGRRLSIVLRRCGLSTHVGPFTRFRRRWASERARAARTPNGTRRPCGGHRLYEGVHSSTSLLGVPRPGPSQRLANIRSQST